MPRARVADPATPSGSCLLLNEVQKQHRQIQEQKEQMNAEVNALTERLSELEKRLEKLAASK